MKRFYSFYLPNFINTQIQSYHSFLTEGLIKELNKSNPISISNTDLYFYSDNYKIFYPEFNIQESIIKNKTYAGKLYIPIKFIDKKFNLIQFHWFLLGHLPLSARLQDVSSVCSIQVKSGRL
eukprot:TRINITY_DN4761_c0_g1_i1.p1 TRINITY_DN4761_c0_g1~~TRINITY_DN4761_c0_g1_i1.p1  ORF type:complete len:136 (+),score=6.72 TRINITY_DN4761_c0_g1_i1:45-410(+)